MTVDSNLIQQAEHALEHAKRALSEAGYVPDALLFEKGGALAIMPIIHKSDEEKEFHYLLQSAVLCEAAADWYVKVSDVWVGKPGSRPSQQAGRREAINVVLVTREATLAWIQYYASEPRRAVLGHLRPAQGLLVHWPEHRGRVDAGNRPIAIISTGFSAYIPRCPDTRRSRSKHEHRRPKERRHRHHGQPGFVLGAGDGHHPHR